MNANTITVTFSYGAGEVVTITDTIDLRYEKPAKVAKAIAKVLMGRVISFTVA